MLNWAVQFLGAFEGKEIKNNFWKLNDTVFYSNPFFSVCERKFDNNTETERQKAPKNRLRGIWWGTLISGRRDTMERKNNDLSVPLSERNGRRIWLSQVSDNRRENRLRNVFNRFGRTKRRQGQTDRQRRISWKEKVEDDLLSING